MIWVGALGGAGPISESGSTVATPTVAGSSWDLYSGMNGQMRVFSFVAKSNQESFSADLYEFVSYLSKNQNVSGDQYLQSIGGGTEPFVGTDGVLTSTSFSLSVA
jgi:xyloglucan-specific endo-beta-1,4-glucanase